jgi:2-iminobutanoate/2-iminopropanoate deaminase
MQIIGEAMAGPGGMLLPFSPAVEARGLVFVSGQLALQGGAIVGDDIGAQTQVVFDNIEAVLGQAGLALTDVVKCTIWLRRAADFAAFNTVYAQRLAEHRPARSTVVSNLVLAEALVEIEVVAARA